MCWKSKLWYNHGIRAFDRGAIKSDVHHLLTQLSSSDIVHPRLTPPQEWNQSAVPPSRSTSQCTPNPGQMLGIQCWYPSWRDHNVIMIVISTRPKILNNTRSILHVMRKRPMPAAVWRQYWGFGKDAEQHENSVFRLIIFGNLSAPLWSVSSCEWYRRVCVCVCAVRHFRYTYYYNAQKCPRNTYAAHIRTTQSLSARVSLLGDVLG